jgi:hypothetical protein
MKGGHLMVSLIVAILFGWVVVHIGLPLEISGIFAKRAGRRAGRPVQQRRESVRGPTPSRLLSCLCAWLIRLP